MNVYAYIVPIDDGAAPNPYGGVCTLAICKPNLRKIAQVDDWVLGFNYNQNGLFLIYAMKLTDVLSMEAYDAFTKASLCIKIPNMKSNDVRYHMGDSVYDFGSDSITLREGVHSRCTKEMDLAGKNVLMSKHFYYFGSKSVALPQNLNLNVRIEDDFIQLNNEASSLFFRWFEKQAFEVNRLYAQPHRIGVIASSSKSVQKSCCIRKQVERAFV